MMDDKTISPADGASRHNIPHYFLVAMTTSGLFKSLALPVIQGVLYIHDEAAANEGGEFLIFNKGPEHDPMNVKTTPNTGFVFDGSQYVQTMT